MSEKLEKGIECKFDKMSAALQNMTKGNETVVRKGVSAVRRTT